MKLAYLGLLILAVAAVAIADVFLKKASIGHTLSQALKSPWILGAVLLYLFQIFFFVYLFDKDVQITNVGILQTALYAIIVVGSGFLIFNEALTGVQIVGAILAFVGVILINIK